MGKIVAIGGGEIGRPGYPIETTEIDRQIIKLTGKTRPRVLLLPTASSDSDVYLEAFEKHFGKRLGCKTDVLLLVKARPHSMQEIEEKILGSDAVYVGGGNTARMMRIWRKLGVDKVLRKAYGKGIVLSGLSAGAICWFRYGSSDSRKFANPDAGLIRIQGLGFINALVCPHYDVEEDRKPKLKEIMKKTPGVAIALDNCSAIEIVDVSYRVLSSRNGAHAYRVYWSRGRFYEEAIPIEPVYKPLTTLLSK